LKRVKQRYSTDKAYRDAKIDSDTQRYYNDEVYRHAKFETAKLKSKERYDNDKDYRNQHKKKVANRIIGRYWGDKSYNEKIKTSARLYRRTHKDKGKITFRNTRRWQKCRLIFVN
jgi:hypothetical protein